MTEQRALELAYRYLNRRERTVAEMRRHLEARGCRADDIEAAIEQIQADGFLNDARYARMFAEDKRTLEQWGTERIERALLQRGIDRGLIAEAIGDNEDGGDLPRALALLEQRLQQPPRDRRERDRALGILLRKGYEPELALDALAAYARDGGDAASG
jgi:regulatory protein